MARPEGFRASAPWGRFFDSRQGFARGQSPAVLVFHTSESGSLRPVREHGQRCGRPSVDGGPKAPKSGGEYAQHLLAVKTRSRRLPRAGHTPGVLGLGPRWEPGHHRARGTPCGFDDRGKRHCGSSPCWREHAPQDLYDCWSVQAGSWREQPTAFQNSDGALRIIHACMSPPRIRERQGRASVHPRARGRTDRTLRIDAKTLGSSPRARVLHQALARALYV